MMQKRSTAQATNRQRRRVGGPALAVLLVFGHVAGSQALPAGGPPRQVRAERVPADLQPHMKLLGERIDRPEKARTILDGEFVDAQGNRSEARIVRQPSGETRLEGMKADGTALVFDGVRTRASGVVSARDEGVLESLVADTAGGLLVAVNHGAGVTLLGRGFRPDSSVAPDYNGPSFDIFEVVAEAPTRTDRPRRGKRFHFDTDTGLLRSTRYEDGGRRVETRFSDWARIDGSFHPGRIERFEDGVRVFSFIASGVSSSPVIDDDTFVRP